MELIKIALLVLNLIMLAALLWGRDRRISNLEVVLTDHIKTHPQFFLSADGTTLSVTNVKGTQADIQGTSTVVH